MESTTLVHALVGLDREDEVENIVGVRELGFPSLTRLKLGEI
jgi:hypothetical protein